MPPRTRSSISPLPPNYQSDLATFKPSPSTPSIHPAQPLLSAVSIVRSPTNPSLISSPTAAAVSTQMKTSVSPPISGFLHPTSVASIGKPRSSGSSKSSSAIFGSKSSKHSKPKMSRKLSKSNIELTTIEKGVMVDGTEFDLEFRIEEGSGRQLVRGKQGRWFDFNPSAGKEGGEYECFVCDKIYTGKHARSIWRRHLSDKHKIPLSAQPRRTRWDKVDDRRPKTDEERRARSLASKRRWAKRKRAEARSRLPSVKEGAALSSDFDSQASGSDIGYDEYDSDETSRDLADGNLSYDYPPASGGEYPISYEQNYPRGLGKGKGRGASLDALGDEVEFRRSQTSTRTVLTEKNSFGGSQQSYPYSSNHSQPYISSQDWSPNQTGVWHNPSPGFATFYPHHPAFQATYGQPPSQPSNPPHQVTLSTHYHQPHHTERQINVTSTTYPYSPYPPPSRMSPPPSSVLSAQIYPSPDNTFNYHHPQSSDEQSSSTNISLVHPHPQHYGSRLTAPAPIIRQSSVPLLAKALEFSVKTGTNGYDMIVRPASAAASPERPSYAFRTTASESNDLGIRNTGGANPWANPPSGGPSDVAGWSYKSSWAETGGVEDGAAELLLQLKTGSSPVKFDESAERTDRNGHAPDGIDREQRRDRHRVDGRMRGDELQENGDEEQDLPWGQASKKHPSESDESLPPSQNIHRLHNNPFALKRSTSGGSLDPQSPSVPPGRPSVARSRSLSRHPPEPLTDDILAPVPSSGKTSHSTPHLSGAYSLSLRPQVGSWVLPVPDSPASQPRTTQTSHRPSRHQDLSSPVGLPQTSLNSNRELDRAGPAEPRAPFGVIGTPTPSIRSTSLGRVVVVKPAWLDSKDLDEEDLDGRPSGARERERLEPAGDSDAEGEDEENSSDRSDEFRFRGCLSSPPQPASNVSTPRSHRVNTLKRKLGEQVVKEPVFALPQVPPRRSITATTPLIHSLGGSVTLPTIFPTPYKSSSSSTTLVYTPSLSSTRTPFRPTPGSAKSSVRLGGPSLADSSSSLRAMSSTSKSIPFGTSSPPSGHQFSSPQSLSLTRSLGLAPATPAGFGTWDVGAGFGTPEEANGGISGGGGPGIKFNATPGRAGGSAGGGLFLESGKKRRGSWAVGRSMLATVAAAGGRTELVFGDVKTSEIKPGEKRERKEEDREESDGDGEQEVAEPSLIGKARKKMRVRMNENDSGFFETRDSS
ncbi:hypothetical protein [Phaffia rhodozyma]|uniref:Uncharacterized protein n=1 Tax=Phaffia rhodozyma TaxID=264483 RepID=A0A0F7SKA5_PHARH|nr:hypothetical protein [Phaffia rhodozyma]